MILCLSDLWLPFPGGAERLIFNLSRDLLRRGEDMRVLTSYGPARQFDGPVVAVEALGVRDEWLEGLQVIARYIDAWQPDLILTHHFYASQFGDALVALGIPVVQVVLNGARVEGAALAVYISQWVYDRCDPEPGDLVITPPAFEDIVAASHGDAIGFVKPIEHKGVELVYRIAEALPDREFVILRGEWQNIEIIRDDLPNVRYMEPVVDMRDFYAECRVLLVPSRSEDAGTVAQEATLNGLPCISSDVEGLRETNLGGVRLPPDDLDAWLSAIIVLDSENVYAEVVARQRAELALVNHPALLDEFAARIAALSA